MIEYKVNKVLIVCKLLYPCSSYFGLNDKGNLDNVNQYAYIRINSLTRIIQ